MSAPETETVETAQARLEAWRRANKIVCSGTRTVGEVFVDLEKGLNEALALLKAAKRRDAKAAAYSAVRSAKDATSRHAQRKPVVPGPAHPAASSKANP